MLQSRITLLKTYLSRLPPSYLTTASPPSPSPSPPPSEEHTSISHPLLRSILALTARLPLLTPADASSFGQESQAEKSDVSLVALLGSLGRSIKDAKGLGATFGAMESMKSGGRKGAFGSMGMGMGMGFSGGGEESMGIEEDGSAVW